MNSFTKGISHAWRAIVLCMMYDAAIAAVAMFFSIRILGHAASGGSGTWIVVVYIIFIRHHHCCYHDQGTLAGLATHKCR